MTRHTIAEENKTFGNTNVFLELGACWWTDERIFLTQYGGYTQKPLAFVRDIQRDQDGKITAEFETFQSGISNEEIDGIAKHCEFGIELHQLARNITKREGLMTIEKGRIMAVAIIPPSPGFPRMNLSEIEVPYYGD
jgi:hypothetical protein